jgi:hypothetical protein
VGATRAIQSQSATQLSGITPAPRLQRQSQYIGMPPTMNVQSLMFVAKWTLAYLLGEAVGRGGAAILGNVTRSDAVGVIGLVGIGIAVGFTQWILLRRRLDYSQWWILLTAIGWAVGIFSPVAFIDTYNFLTRLVSEIYQGVVLGTMQWLVLRRSVSQAAWWILIVSIAEALGFGANGIGSALWPGSHPPWGPIEAFGHFALSGAIVGAVEGVITGFGLGILLQRAGKALGPLKQELPAER